jgi:hypothetical protein
MELPTDWRKALTAVNTRLREIVPAVPAAGLDKTMEDIEDLVVAVWSIENQGALRHVVDETPVVNRFAEAFQAPLHKIAPPPPKKIKRDTPPRKVLPLSETGAVRGIDAIMLVRALVEIGDFTRQTDKARAAHLLFLDDWRRLVWESARIPSWDRFRQLAAGEPAWAPRVPVLRFSRRSAITLLEAMSKYRVDLITPIPAVSMIGCQGCGKHDGRERVRCATCQKLFCGKCLARTAELCLADYAQRYRPLPAETRTSLFTAARDLCKRFRLDEFVRNASFAKALAEYGVDVVFDEHAPEGGAEETNKQGKISLRVKDRENATTKKILFAALGRCLFREAGSEPDAEQSAYFLDICLGLPIEEHLGGSVPSSPVPGPSSPNSTTPVA